MSREKLAIGDLVKGLDTFEHGWTNGWSTLHYTRNFWRALETISSPEGQEIKDWFNRHLHNEIKTMRVGKMALIAAVLDNVKLGQLIFIVRKQDQSYAVIDEESLEFIASDPDNNY